MAESRENALLKSFFMTTAVAEIASEVLDIFENSTLDHEDYSDSEEAEDFLEVSNLIKECRSLVQGEDASMSHLDTIMDSIQELPKSILTPYSQLYRLKSGTRMNNENWESKFDTEVYLEKFRFRKADMALLASALEVPETFTAGNSYRSTKMEGLHIVLRRLATPSRWIDICADFCLTPQSMSVIFNHLISIEFRKWADFVRTLDHDWLDTHHIQEYAAAYEEKGCPLKNCVLSIDGTKHCFSRPGHGFQAACYCGHWHEHCLGYQFIQLPNGHNLVFGPFNGFEHDSTSVKMIHLEEKLCDKLRVDGKEYVAYLDSGYALGHFFITPFSRRRELTQEEKQFNRVMSAMRQSSEWGIGRIKTLWSYLEFKRNLRVLSMPLSMMFLFSVHLGNIHSCLYGNQTAQFFDCPELSLAEYLGLME